MSRDGRPVYQRQLSEPSIPFPPQGFKQEFPDPLFEHPAVMGTPVSSSYPASIMIKQEPRDFTYDPGEGGATVEDGGERGGGGGCGGERGEGW